MENKKHWITPSIQTLNIKRDTFSGSKTGTENQGNVSGGSNKPSDGVADTARGGKR